MSKNPKPFDTAVGKRLLLTREALRMTQREFASAAGFKESAYGQYETGARTLLPERAIALCHAHKVTLEWIYLGEIGTLPYKLGAAIRAMIDLSRDGNPD
jgi:transcriptional regulator with XRE-family HTH domain